MDCLVVPTNIGFYTAMQYNDKILIFIQQCGIMIGLPLCTRMSAKVCMGEINLNIMWGLGMAFVVGILGFCYLWYYGR